MTSYCQFFESGPFNFIQIVLIVRVLMMFSHWSEIQYGRYGYPSLYGTNPNDIWLIDKYFNFWNYICIICYISVVNC